MTMTNALEAWCGQSQSHVAHLWVNASRLYVHCAGFYNPAEVHRPMRGSDVEAWIKRARDQHEQDLELTDAYIALDYLLDDYRLHADTATPLTSDVDEMGG